ncbi:hypothetical protein SOM70_36635 [Streptomyces salinarius]|uniref:hypothetical protein n=1 Tax=Streptomyces salinarius TaxID=2762598 RepID=UPI0032DE46CC
MRQGNPGAEYPHEFLTPRVEPIDQPPGRLLAFLDGALAVLDPDVPAIHTVTVALMARGTGRREVGLAGQLHVEQHRRATRFQRA